MGSSKSGSGGDSTTEIRYAPYLEAHHEQLLANYWTAVTTLLSTVDTSPYQNYTDIEVEDAFFGTGYTIASFPSLYDMYGKFMAGLDIETLWDQAFSDTTSGPLIDTLVGAEADLMDDDIESNILPRMQVGMRDMNAVMASTYVVGKALIEQARVKSLSKFDAELRYRLIPVAEARWSKHLDWNRTVIGVYADIMKVYYMTKLDVDDRNYSIAARDLLWPFTVMEYYRVAVGTLSGAKTQTTDTAGTSTIGKALGGAAAGAAMGAPFGPQGAAIGGVIGFTAGLLS